MKESAFAVSSTSAAGFDGKQEGPRLTSLGDRIRPTRRTNARYRSIKDARPGLVTSDNDVGIASGTRDIVFFARWRVSYFHSCVSIGGVGTSNSGHTQREERYARSLPCVGRSLASRVYVFLKRFVGLRSGVPVRLLFLRCAFSRFCLFEISRCPSFQQLDRWGEPRCSDVCQIITSATVTITHTVNDYHPRPPVGPRAGRESEWPGESTAPRLRKAKRSYG